MSVRTLVLAALLAPVLSLDPPAARTVRAPSSQQSTWKELRRDLRSRYPDERRRAVAKLADLGTKDALELVLAALGDTDPEPADEAQRVVVQLEGVGATRALLGRAGLAARDALVRRRAAEAIGRLQGPVDGGKLAALLDRREPELACTLLWSIERLARRGALSGDPAVTARRLQPLLGRPAEDGVRAAALQALAGVDGLAAADRAASWLGERGQRQGPRAIASALEALVRADRQGTIELVTHHLTSHEPLVRAKAIQLASEGAATRATLAALAGRLEAEPRIALRERALSALRGLTGMRHGPDVRAWRHTINGLEPDWSPRPAPSGGRDGGDDAAGRTVAALRRLAPRSDRLAILVDFSGSLWNERPDGSCRKDLVDPEMTELLSRLDADGTFFLVPFTHELHPYSEAPLRATPRNVRAAQRFFERAKMRGQGNLADAIQLALAQPEIDRILVLTDGAPTGGSRWNVELMIEWIQQRTRFRPVILDFVLIDTPPGLARKWRTLSEGSGGRTLSVET